MHDCRPAIHTVWTHSSMGAPASDTDTTDSRHVQVNNKAITHNYVKMPACPPMIHTLWTHSSMGAPAFSTVARHPDSGHVQSIVNACTQYELYMVHRLPTCRQTIPILWTQCKIPLPVSASRIHRLHVKRECYNVFRYALTRYCNTCIQVCLMSFLFICLSTVLKRNWQFFQYVYNCRKLFVETTFLIGWTKWVC